MRRSGIWREFTERKWGWQARTAGATAAPVGRTSGRRDRTGRQAAAVRRGLRRPPCVPCDVSGRSHRSGRHGHHGLMYWNSDRFCSCT
ncbi:hypothetical protein C6P77_14415 [Burkholderia ambifaria]|nr:hypothetical protein C6P77_14415 [Burkholderia ambifaria]